MITFIQHDALKFSRAQLDDDAAEESDVDEDDNADDDEEDDDDVEEDGKNDDDKDNDEDDFDEEEDFPASAKKDRVFAVSCTQNQAFLHNE